MKVLALNGSHNKEGVTYNALKIVGEELQKEGIGISCIAVGRATPLVTTVEHAAS